MTTRDAIIDRFLVGAGWGDAMRSPLAGDASNRRYERLKDAARHAVLMDAPPEKGEDVRPFVAIAKHLFQHGLSAPRIIASDPEHGLLILEDLGDAIYARILEQDPSLELEIYKAAADALITLHAAPLPKGTAAYDTKAMTDKAVMALDWYLRGADGPPPRQTREAFCAEIETCLENLAPETDVLILRDYHAENLLWLPDRSGPARVGQLDFQDAMAGHPAYDLQSLLKDARRDLGDGIEEAVLAYFITQSGADPVRFRAAYAVLGAQRNLRILGTFARLSLHFGKPHYVELIPRVWGHLVASLDHPDLASLRETVLGILPPPTPAILQSLKDQCATVDTP